jgi:GrpB-like predicted nucleotidyltransferase (UPF0157 family)
VTTVGTGREQTVRAGVGVLLQVVANHRDQVRGDRNITHASVGLSGEPCGGALPERDRTPGPLDPTFANAAVVPTDRCGRSSDTSVTRTRNRDTLGRSTRDRHQVRRKRHSHVRELGLHDPIRRMDRPHLPARQTAPWGTLATVTSAPDPRRPDVTTVEMLGGIEKRALVLADYDPQWPKVYEEHRGRIRAALGPAAVQVEHIGSTSVLGLAAKPIIDVLVTVEDITAEEDYLDQLLDVGYELRVREPGHRLVRSPAREVHVHIVQAGDATADDYLLVRDRLRADREDRELYERTKRALIEQDWSDMNAYAEAKTDVIAEIKERVRQSTEAAAADAVRSRGPSVQSES